MRICFVGTEDECSRFCTNVRGSIPKECLRSISTFYPNQYSNEGRIYIEVSLPPENKLTVEGPE